MCANHCSCPFPCWSVLDLTPMLFCFSWVPSSVGVSVLYPPFFGRRDRSGELVFKGGELLEAIPSHQNPDIALACAHVMC